MSGNEDEYLAVDESTDDDGSIAYIDYEMGEDEAGEEDGFFVEYVNEIEDDTLANAADDGVQYEEEPPEGDGFTEYFGSDDLNEDDLYNCNLCGMDFKSITEHIEKFHSNEDVVIDVMEKSGAAIKTEKQTDPLAEDASVDENEFITAESDLAASQMIVYGDDHFDENNDFLDDLVDEDENDVYTYDESTGVLTKTQMKAAANKKENAKAKELYNCTRCSGVFETLRALSSHLLSVHEREITSSANKKNAKPVSRTAKPAVKRKAKPKATEEEDPDYNEKTTVDESDHTCDICNTNFYSAKSLKLHARMHLPVKAKTLDDATADHILDTTPSSERDSLREKFFCGICGKYYDKTFEEVHVQMHNGEEKFNCGICNKLFANEESIKMHMNAHQETRVIKTKAEQNNIKLPYGCQYCGKEFARPHEKVKHERVHTGEKPYECDICGKCFRVSYCLTIHMRTHTDARPYVCPHCNKRFKAQSVYNHHLLTHSEERNYKCPFCPKTFKTSVQLSGHKNSHTKPFSCTECNRPFGSLYAVRAHMESHKRPNHNLKHICDICGAKYARRFALNDHIKEQHKDVDVQIVNPVLGRKSQPKRAKKSKEYAILPDEEEEEEEEMEELEVAGQSILENVVEQEITIGEIEHFENEEEVVDVDWLK